MCISHPMGRGDYLNNLRKSIKWLRDNWIGICLGGTFVNWVTLTVKGLFTKQLSWKIVFVNVESGLFFAVLLTCLFIWFIRFLKVTIRRSRDEKENRLVEKIVSKMNQEG